jgi:hypothetical protein
MEKDGVRTTKLVRRLVGVEHTVVESVETEQAAMARR